MVARFERALLEIEELAGQWALVDGEKLSDLQRERVRAAVQALEGRLEKVKLKVG